MNQIGADPLFSLVMVVKDGMPYVKDALASVAAQTYRNFELVIQDGASTDGTLEAIHSIQGIPNLHLESAPDSGPSEGFNLAVRRCQGDIIGSIYADDVLEPDALEKVVAAFAEHPSAAVIYGGCKFIDETGELIGEFQPNSFNLLQLMSCQLVPPFSASFFARQVCTDRLYFDSDLITELGFWLRLSHLPIVKVDQFFSRVRSSSKSRTFQPDFYDRICHDKIQAVEQYLSQFAPSPVINELRQYCTAGVYAWAAESMRWIPEGTDDQFNHYYEQAEGAYPNSDRLQMIKLQQTLTQTQQEYARVGNALHQAQIHLGETQAQLAATQTQFRQLQEANHQMSADFQQAIERLHETIAAMESTKFWQMRTQWLKLKSSITGLLKR